MDVQAELATAVGMQDGSKFAVGCFPANRDLLKGWGSLASVDDVPAPIIQARNVPAVLQAVVEQEDLAQEVASAKKVGLFVQKSWSQFYRYSFQCFRLFWPGLPALLYEMEQDIERW